MKKSLFPHFRNFEKPEAATPVTAEIDPLQERLGALKRRQEVRLDDYRQKILPNSVNPDAVMQLEAAGVNRGNSYQEKMSLVLFQSPHNDSSLCYLNETGNFIVSHGTGDYTSENKPFANYQEAGKYLNELQVASGNLPFNVNRYDYIFPPENAVGTIDLLIGPAMIGETKTYTDTETMQKEIAESNACGRLIDAHWIVPPQPEITIPQPYIAGPQAVGYIKYHDSGEVLEFSSCDALLDHYKSAVHQRGPMAQEAVLLCNNAEAGYGLLKIEAGEFGLAVDKEQFVALVQQYGAASPEARGAIEWEPEEEL